MREFQHEGVYFFDPRDGSTVDAAWRDLKGHGPAVIDKDDLLAKYDWGRVARSVIGAHERSMARDGRSGARAA